MPLLAAVWSWRDLVLLVPLIQEGGSEVLHAMTLGLCRCSDHCVGVPCEFRGWAGSGRAATEAAEECRWR